MAFFIICIVAPQFYVVFKYINQCDPKWLWCTWHVDKAWKQEIRSITDPLVQKEVYQSARTLLDADIQRREQQQHPNDQPHNRNNNTQVQCGRGLRMRDGRRVRTEVDEEALVLEAVLLEAVVVDEVVECVCGVDVGEVDNFYTSPTLAKDLERKTYFCGTIKKSRKNYCSEIQHVALKKGFASFY